MEKKVHKLDLGKDVKKDEFIQFEGTYWIVVNPDIEQFNGKGVLLSDEIPPPILKELGTEWTLVEESDQDFEWSKRGIFIHSKLRELDQNNELHQYNLGVALFENAIYLKRTTRTRLKAKEMFEEVISLGATPLMKNLCHYYIGFINYFDSEWEKAIRQFEIAIEMGKLDYFQELRAYCNLGISYSQLGKIEQAKQCIEMAKEKDVNYRSTPEIHATNLQIEANVDKIKPYILLTKDNAIRISSDEADAIVDKYDENGFDLLDCRNSEAFFRGPDESFKLNIYMDLLRLLMESPSPLTKKEIIDKLEEINPGKRTLTPEILGMDIKRLREKLEPCYHDQLESVIKTVNVLKGQKGYQWCSPQPYQIIIPIHQHLINK